MAEINFLRGWEKRNYHRWIDKLNTALKIKLENLQEDFVVSDHPDFWVEQIQLSLYGQTGTIYHDGLKKNILTVPLLSQLKYLLRNKMLVYRHNLLPYTSSGYILTKVLVGKNEYMLYRVVVNGALPSGTAIFAIIPEHIDGIIATIPNATEARVNQYFATQFPQINEVNGITMISAENTVPTYFSIGYYRKGNWHLDQIPFMPRHESIRIVMLESVIRSRVKSVDLVKHRATFTTPLSEILDHSNPRLPFCLSFISNFENLKSWGHRSGWPDVLRCMNTISNPRGTPLLVVDIIEDIFSWRVLEQERYKQKHVHYNGRSYMIPWSSVKIKDTLHIVRLDDGTILNFKGEWTKHGAPTPEEYDTLMEIKKQEIVVPWIGFWHNPQGMPVWFDGCHSPEEILKRDFMKKSLRNCRGILTLSKYLRDWLRENIPKNSSYTVPVHDLIHPTEIPDLQFDIAKFRANPHKLLIQVGYWLRHRTAINHLTGFHHGEEIYKRVWLYGAKHALDLIPEECDAEGTSDDFSGVYIERVENDQYDRMFTNNLIFLKILKSSANNAIVECMARNTPVVVNRDPAIVEYLGEKYPLFYDTLEQAQTMIFDFDLIEQAHRYMVDNKLSDRVRFENFLQSFREVMLKLA